MKLSLCMIVKNEEELIERCLKCANEFVDEIVIVDTGSTDKTKDICFKYTNKVYDFEWCDDFSKARNFAFSKATKDYIIWLDADDILQKSEILKILELKDNNKQNLADVYMLKYATAFDNNNNITYCYYRERIIKNCEFAYWQGRVHEVIVPFAKIEYLDIVIEHRKIFKKLDSNYSNRNIKIYEKMLKENYKFNARDNYYYARELFYHNNYNKAITFFENVINDDNAWIENKIDAYKLLAKCYLRLKDYNKFVENILIGNTINTPRSEICCDLGDYFLSINNIKQAIFWFKSALNCEKNDETGAFIEPDFYYYIPCLKLCICLDKIGKVQEAYEYNKKAEEFKINSEAVKFNNEYFKNKLKGSDIYVL